MKLNEKKLREQIISKQNLNLSKWVKDIVKFERASY